MTISECVSKRLREILYEKNISIYMLSKISCVSKGTIISIIYNRYKGVNLKTIIILIQALNVSILTFFDNPLFDNMDMFDLD